MAYALLLAGVLLVLLAHWPGRLHSDSSAMLAGARGDFPIVDHWSATLTWVWQRAYELAGIEAGGVFLAQTFALATGLYLVLRSCFDRVAAAGVASLILIAPPAFGFVGAIGRDAWFVAGCVLAVGLAIAAHRSTERRFRIAALLAGLVAAGTAIAARQNGVTAAAPALIALAAVAIGMLPAVRAAYSGWRRRAATAAGLGLSAALVLTVVATLADRAALDRARHPEVVTYLYDLGHLTLETGDRLIPPLPRDAFPVQTVAEVRRRWQPTTALYMRADPDGRSLVESGTRIFIADDEAKRLERAWRDAVREHPSSYLRGRLTLWKHQVGVGHTPLYSRVPVAEPDSYGHRPPAAPALSDLATSYAALWGEGTEENLNGGFLHHAWAYLLACMLGLLLALPRFPSPVRLAAALPAAAVGLQVGLFFLAPSVQWRFQLLTVYAALVTAAIGLRLARDKASSPRG